MCACSVPSVPVLIPPCDFGVWCGSSIGFCFWLCNCCITVSLSHAHRHSSTAAKRNAFAAKKQRGLARSRTHRERWETHLGMTTPSTVLRNLTVSPMLVTPGIRGTRHRQRDGGLPQVMITSYSVLLGFGCLPTLGL